MTIDYRAQAPAVQRVVLDSFALLAYYQREPGGAVVRDLLDRASRGEVQLAMANVNLAEVYYSTYRAFGSRRVDDVLGNANGQSITFHDVDMDLALQAAAIKGEHAMSYADCIAAALALRLDAVLVTGDPEFRQVEHYVRLLWLDRTETSPRDPGAVAPGA